MGKKVRISDESVNCYGTRILTSGIDLAQYQRNPVLLYMHERGKVVGVVEHLEVRDGELLGELSFDKASPLSEQLERQYDFGSLRMVSANFRVLETSADKKLVTDGQTLETVTRCELFEVSAVDIGGNDNAMVLSDRDGNTIALSGDMGASPSLPLLNNVSNNPLKKNEMELKKIALALGMPETATEAEVTAKLDELKLSAANAAALQKEVEGLKTQQATLALAGVTQAVDAAVKEKRVTESMRTHFVELGKKVGLEALQTTLSAMQPHVKLSETIGRTVGAQPQAAGEFGNYQKLSEVPSGVMEDLHDNHHDEFVRLYKAEYGFEPA